MIPIEIAVCVEDQDDHTAFTELLGVVQLPCPPFEGIKFESPDGNCINLELRDLVFDLRKGMFCGSLRDVGEAEALPDMIQGWRDVGFRTYRELNEAAE